MPADRPETNTVLISGCLRNHANTSRFQSAQCDRAGSGSLRTAFESGQLECVIETPCQRCFSAATSTAARQWEAWLSPTSATVRLDSSAATLNPHTSTRSSAGENVQGAFGRSRASTGVGVTLTFSAGFSQGWFQGSRAAAPKQRGASSPCAWAPATPAPRRATACQEQDADPTQHGTSSSSPRACRGRAPGTGESVLANTAVRWVASL